MRLPPGISCRRGYMDMGQPNGRVVCIVHDDASLRRSLRNLLMSLGFRVETFASPEAFLEPVPPDGGGCRVLDVRMPASRGVDLRRHRAAPGPPLPASLLTAPT